jgi:hypothetical protein
LLEWAGWLKPVTGLGIDEFEANLVVADVDDLATVLDRAEQKHIQGTDIVDPNRIADVFVDFQQCTGRRNVFKIAVVADTIYFQQTVRYIGYSLVTSHVGHDITPFSN